MKESQKQEPYLLVTTGFPCSGKSLIAGHLEKKLGFTRISTDDIREKLWSIDSIGYEAHRNDPLFREKETSVFEYLRTLKLEQVLKGNNVIIDATAFHNLSREEFFNTHYLKNEEVMSEILAKKILLELNTPPKEIIKRNKAKGRENDVYNDWKGYWQEPTGNGYEIITFKNSRKTDIPRIFTALDRLFS